MLIITTIYQEIGGIIKTFNFMEIINLITPEEAEIINVLITRKALFMKNGSVTLNFDRDGKLQTIQRNDFLYSAKHDIS